MLLKDITAKIIDLYKSEIIYSDQVENLSMYVINVLFNTYNEKILIEFVNCYSQKKSISVSEFLILLSTIKRNLKNELISSDMNEIFFTYLFRFVYKNDQFPEMIQNFLFYVFQNFSLNESLISFITSLTFAYNLNDFAFYYYIKNPYDLDYLNMIFGSSY